MGGKTGERDSLKLEREELDVDMDVRGDREGEAEGGVGSLGGETVKGAGVGPLRPLIRLREGEYGEG